MKKAWAKYIIPPSIFFALIGITALFRAVLDKIAYLIALDIVISTVIRELWKFITTPTIFIAILIAYVLWIFRKNIIAILPAIKEIKAGSFSATLDYAPENKSGSTDDNSATVTIDKYQTEYQTEAVDVIINELGEIACNIFLSFDEKVSSTDDWLNKFLEKDYLEFSSLTGISENDKRNVYIGVFKTLEAYIFDFLFSMKLSNDNNTAYITLLPGIREKLEARLQYLQNRSSKLEDSEKVATSKKKIVESSNKTKP
jgi:hypothetical protein